MKDKYLAFDGINHSFDFFETIEEAREYLKESFYSEEENSYHPDMESCKIYKLEEVTKRIVIPDEHKEVDVEYWKHDFVKVKE